MSAAPTSGEVHVVDPRLITDERSLTINGRAVEPDGASWEDIDPTTEELLAVVSGASVIQVDDAVDAARQAFPTWSNTSGATRGQHLHRLADAIEARGDELVRSVVTEIGTPISTARKLHLELALSHLRWQADAASLDRTVQLGPWHDPVATVSEVVLRPVGVVAAIAGYNFPLNLAIWKFGAALAAGCTVVLLSSPLAPLTTLLLGQAIREADLPPGVLNVIVGEAACGVRLSEHRDVDRLSFTGSDEVGARIMAQAAPTLKRLTLELGGKSPSILFPGIDVAVVARESHMRWSRNGGQACAALTRLLVHESIFDEFIAASHDAFEHIVVGNPWDPATTVGPMVSARHRDRVRGYIDSIRAGGEIAVAVTSPIPDRGYFVNPVLGVGLPPDAKAVREEIFGPVAVALPFRDDEEAIALANDTAYGLAANIWTPDIAAGRRLAAQIRAGTVWINGGGGMRPDAPFGGFGRSGIGRELGEWGIREFLEPQHVQWRT